MKPILLFALTTALWSMAPRTPVVGPGGVLLQVDPRLPHPVARAEDLPSVASGARSLAELVEEGRRAWFASTLHEGEPFGLPWQPHVDLDPLVPLDAVGPLLAGANRILPTGLQPNPDGGLPLGLVFPQGPGRISQSCAACHTAQVNGVLLAGTANRFYQQQNMFRATRSALRLTEVLLRLVPGQHRAAQDSLRAERAKVKRYEALQNLGCEEQLAPGVVTGVRIWHASTGVLRSPEQLANEQDRARFPCGVVKIPPLNTLRFRNRFFWDGSINTTWPGRWPVLDFLGVERVDEWRQRQATPTAEALDAFVMFSTPSPRWQDLMAEPLERELLPRGRELFHGAARCASCHGQHDADGRLTGYAPTITPLSLVRTDPERAQAARRDVLETFGKLREAFVPRVAWDEEPGYAALPLCSTFLNAPYLHTGGVASLAELLLPQEQRSRMQYPGETTDPVDVGYYTSRTLARAITRGPARSNFLWRKVPARFVQGHSGPAFGTTLPDADRRALLEYLKTLHCP
ncbi:MAG: hypothetical protein AB2A00_31475 [Myxococcota bacterium]